MYLLVKYKLISNDGYQILTEIERLIDYSENIDKFKHLLSDSLIDVLSNTGSTRIELIDNNMTYLMFLPKMSEKHNMESYYELLREEQLKSIFTVNI